MPGDAGLRVALAWLMLAASGVLVAAVALRVVGAWRVRHARVPTVPAVIIKADYRLLGDADPGTVRHWVLTVRTVGGSPVEARVRANPAVVERLLPGVVQPFRRPAVGWMPLVADGERRHYKAQCPALVGRSIPVALRRLPRGYWSVLVVGEGSIASDVLRHFWWFVAAVTLAVAGAVGLSG